MKNPLLLSFIFITSLIITYWLANYFGNNFTNTISYVSIVGATISNSYLFSKDKRVITCRGKPIDVFTIITYAIPLGMIGGRFVFSFWGPSVSGERPPVQWGDLIVCIIALIWLVCDAVINMKKNRACKPGDDVKDRKQNADIDTSSDLQPARQSITIKEAEISKIPE